MKGSRFAVSLLLLAFLLPLTAGVQAGSPKDPKLYIKSETVRNEFVEIVYEVTFEGFVELHLFNPDGKKIWIKGKVTDRQGLDKIRIPRKPLNDGERYTFKLKYKGKEYEGRFYT
ncbi:MAG: hypothetical protein AAF587_02005 [Bacteroidota bacterium]